MDGLVNTFGKSSKKQRDEKFCVNESYNASFRWHKHNFSLLFTQGDSDAKMKLFGFFGPGTTARTDCIEILH